MRTQRIGLVLSNVPGYSETFFRNKIKGLQEHGFEVLLFVNENNSKQTKFLCKTIIAPTFSSNPVLKFANIIRAVANLCFKSPKKSYQLYQLDKKDGLSFRNRIKHVFMNQFLLSEKLDWLHFGFGMLAVGRENVAQAIGAKMAVSFRGFDLYLSPLKHKNCYDVLFTKKVKYHVLSQEMRHDLINDYNVSESAIEVITPAIDVGFFKSDKASQERDIANILTVGRLHWKKGLEYTLEALAQLKQEGIEFRYTIVGEGTEKERLLYAAHQLDILGWVTFKGKLEHHQVKMQMNQSNIYLQYSIQEGFCNAVLEAQAMGLMCIVSNAEGLSENVLHTKTGWVVPKRDPKALKETIKKVLEIPIKDKVQIRENARRRVKNEFHILQQQQGFVKFYSE